MPRAVFRPVCSNICVTTGILGRPMDFRPEKLDARVARLDALLASTAPGLSVAARTAVERWRADAAALRFHLSKRQTDAPPLVAVLGGTGTGKSTLVNRLLGANLSAASFRRTFTAGPVAICRDAETIPDGWLGVERVVATPDQLPARGEPGTLVVVPVPGDDHRPAHARRHPRPRRRPARPPRPGRPRLPLGRSGAVPRHAREVPDDRAAAVLPARPPLRRSRAARDEQVRGAGGARRLPRDAGAGGVRGQESGSGVRNQVSGLSAFSDAARGAFSTSGAVFAIRATTPPINLPRTRTSTRSARRCSTCPRRRPSSAVTGLRVRGAT